MRKGVVPALITLTILTGCASTPEQSFGPALSRAHAAGLPLLVYALGVPGQILTHDSHTAVPVYIQFVVTSHHPLKRVTFTLAGYTARGIAVRARDGKPVRMTLIGPGPFRPSGNYEVNSFHSRPAGFPGGAVACVELLDMAVTYVNGQNRHYALHPDDANGPLLGRLSDRCADQGPTVSRMMGGSG